MKALLTLVLLSTSVTFAALDDIDGDGLLNSEEDLNGNGIVEQNETDPYDADTDGGGESDGAEVMAGRNPLDHSDDYTFDRDNDGLSNGEEADLFTDPDVADTDADGLNDSRDPFPLEEDYKTDHDSDGIPDEYEALHGLSSEVRSDADEDLDEDGLTNREEFIMGTDIDNADTDGDGVDDAREVEVDTDPLENPCLYYGGTGKHFADVQDHWSSDYVLHFHQTKAFGRRLIEGTDTPTATLFMPDEKATRYEVLRMALLGSCTPPLPDEEYSAGVEFSDLSFKVRPHESLERTDQRQLIKAALERGIISGYPDGTFRPSDSINRAEALKILVNTGRIELYDDAPLTDFPDVHPTDWFAPYVEQATALGVVEGYDDGLFRPGNSITRAEAVKLTLLFMIINPRVNGYVVPIEDL